MSSIASPSTIEKIPTIQIPIATVVNRKIVENKIPPCHLVTISTARSVEAWRTDEITGRSDTSSHESVDFGLDKGNDRVTRSVSSFHEYREEGDADDESDWRGRVEQSDPEAENSLHHDEERTPV